jgi:hypothetical protein
MTTPPPFPVLKTVHLTQPVHQPGPRPLRYGIPTFFQVSPTQIALLANIRVTNLPVVDHENGWDTFILSSLDDLKPENAVPGQRNFIETNPHTGEPMVMVHHLPIGGFIPLGAKLPDGSPHPHAGTGFAMGTTGGHPTDHKHPVPSIQSKPGHGFATLLQLKFDGQKLHITSTTRIDRKTFFPGWFTGTRGLSHAIPDGTDLLFPHTGGRHDHAVETYFQKLKASGLKAHSNAGGPLGACVGPIVSRWRCGSQGWQPVSYHQVFKPGPDLGTEPTLLRDVDGSLLCSVRGKGTDVPPGQFDSLGMQNLYESFRVYRSTDNALTWTRHLCLHSMRVASPVTLNKLGDGSLFIAANPAHPILKDSNGKNIPLVQYRHRLWLWPLSPDRTHVQPPLCLLDADSQLGPPRPLHTHSNTSNYWYLDHPLAGAFRLADGNWHNLLGFRVTDGATNSGGAPAAPESGLYMMELPGSQTATSPWNFD